MNVQNVSITQALSEHHYGFPTLHRSYERIMNLNCSFWFILRMRLQRSSSNSSTASRFLQIQTLSNIHVIVNTSEQVKLFQSLLMTRTMKDLKQQHIIWVSNHISYWFPFGWYLNCSPTDFVVEVQKLLLHAVQNVQPKKC